MTAYYNEHDPYAAQWLRNLIDAGHIAPGVVDERSIEDVSPSELSGFTQCHFFAGIGVWSAALRGAGWPDDRPVWTGSCPCQPFSAAGKGGGFDDERHLWPAWFHLIEERRPEIVLGEQVASRDGLAWLDLVQADLEGTGYASRAVDLCAAGVGAPHIRQRLWWVGERLADADQQQRDRSRNAGPRGRGEPANVRATGDLEHATSDGRQQGVANRTRDNERASPQGEPGRLAEPNHVGRSGDDDDERLEGQRNGHQAESGRVGEVRPVAETGEPLRLDHPGTDAGVFHREVASRLADADGGDAGAQRQQRSGQHGQFAEDGRTGELADATRPGPVNGFWRDADWLLCRDGKWRPVEPGAFPLAHGVAGRVGRLRAYGNAINLEAAKVFIGAFIESFDQRNGN